MVDRLAVDRDDDRSLFRQMGRLGEYLSKDARGTAVANAEKQSSSVGGTTDGQETEPQRRTLGHFWCSLLVEMSGAADRVEEMAKAPSEAADSIANATPEEPHPFADALQQELAVLTVRTLMLSQMLHDPVLVMRIMAVFICPDPANHPQVVKQCLVPMFGAVIGDAAAGSLEQAFADPPEE
ncbi:hypothetical protein O4J56_00040 [Nocardiopsis sp. RSe5-2]|uniref:Uncharacterized protein n=1 Tax=Nocardiopsis endophytica TaxID=3018445 RepID=A0ABT4TWE6_9ACTN|nr:hypothetical protein [Nocardiopsis endophytica]MDA2809018.1 hypothetical protein [Nocardiopsis endophytica]